MRITVIDFRDKFIKSIYILTKESLTRTTMVKIAVAGGSGGMTLKIRDPVNSHADRSLQKLPMK